MVLDFPLNNRMYSVWMARAAGRLVSKYDMTEDHIEYYQVLDCISDEIAEDAKDWTGEDIDAFVDSFFRTMTIQISYGDNDND